MLAIPDELYLLIVYTQRFPTWYQYPTWQASWELTFCWSKRVLLHLLTQSNSLREKIVSSASFWCIIIYRLIIIGFTDELNISFICLLVCLIACSVWRHALVLMGPDSNKMFKPGFKKVSCMLILWSMELKERKRLKLVKGKRRERPRPLKFNCTVSLWVKKGKTLFQSQVRLMVWTNWNLHWRAIFWGYSNVLHRDYES